MRHLPPLFVWLSLLWNARSGARSSSSTHHHIRSKQSGLNNDKRHHDDDRSRSLQSNAQIIDAAFSAARSSMNAAIQSAMADPYNPSSSGSFTAGTTSSGSCSSATITASYSFTSISGQSGLGFVSATTRDDATLSISAGCSPETVFGADCDVDLGAPVFNVTGTVTVSTTGDCIAAVSTTLTTTIDTFNFAGVLAVSGALAASNSLDKLDKADVLGNDWTDSCSAISTSIGSLGTDFDAMSGLATTIESELSTRVKSAVGQSIGNLLVSAIETNLVSATRRQSSSSTNPLVSYLAKALDQITRFTFFGG